MKKLFALVLIGMATSSLFTFGVQELKARPTYWTEFDKMYVVPMKDSTDAAEKAKGAKLATAKCNVCHVGKEKKNRNDYGKALNQYLTKADIKNTDKIIESLKKVADEHSEKDNGSSPTFGNLIKEGKLPGGDAP